MPKFCAFESVQLIDPSDIEGQVTEQALISAVLPLVAEQYRMCMLLRDLLDYGITEIAHIMKLRPATIKQYVTRGRDQFIRAYELLSQEVGYEAS